MKTAVMTGATGFVGTALLGELLDNGWCVCVLCRRNSGRRKRLEGLPGVEIVETDLAGADALGGFTDCDVFFHLAWEGGRNDFDAQYQNIAPTLSCLRLSAKLGARAFLCTGSQAEYGETRERITEETPLRPCTSYGAAKTAAHYLSGDLAKQLGVELIWTRVFSVYGPHDNPNSLIPCVAKSLRESGSARLRTDGRHMWNYLHERDAARALRMLAESGEAGVFNVASAVSRPLREYMGMISENITFGNETSGVNLNVATDKLRGAVGEWERTEFAAVKELL